MSVVAAFIADIHLSIKPPKLRTPEPNWFAAMARTLGQVRDIVGFHQVPLIVPGDVFDDGWRVRGCPPELINFAIKHLPPCYAVPGQHDLPHHRYEDIEKSGYWTLVEAGVIKNLDYNTPTHVGGVVLHGFPWGIPVKPGPECSNGLALNVAVVHSYIWKEGFSYPDPEIYAQADSWHSRLQGYDAAAFGDNHQGFLHGKIINCGTLMVRKADELGHQPRVWLLHDDSTFSLERLNTGMDRYLPQEEIAKQSSMDLAQVGKFVASLAKMSKGVYDFKDAMHQWLMAHPDVSDEVKDIIFKSMGAA